MHSAIVDRPIDPSKLLERVAARGNGAAVLFLGTVRDVNAGRGVSGIEYTAYRSMAERELHRIVEEAALLADSNDIAVEHRLGELAIGECSVAVAAARFSSGADSSKFSITASTGALRFITAPSFETPLGHGANGNIYLATVKALTELEARRS